MTKPKLSGTLVPHFANLQQPGMQESPNLLCVAHNILISVEMPAYAGMTLFDNNFFLNLMTLCCNLKFFDKEAAFEFIFIFV